MKKYLLLCFLLFGTFFNYLYSNNIGVEKINSIKYYIEEKIHSNPIQKELIINSINKFIGNDSKDSNYQLLKDLKIFAKNVDVFSGNNIFYKNKLELVDFAYKYLDSKFLSGNSDDIEDIVANFEDSILFVTVLNKGKILCCQGGEINKKSDKNINGLLKKSLDACVNKNGLKDKIDKNELKNLDLIFNFLYNKRPINSNSAKVISKTIQVGKHGIQIEYAGKSVFFKESVPITKNYNLSQTFERLCAKAELSNDCYKDEKVKIFIYDTLTFKGNRNLDIQNFYRYNVYLDEEQIDPLYIYERLKLSESWFLNNINPNNNILQYEYFPSLNQYSTDNNDVRQMATVWSMSKLSQILNSDKLKTLMINTLNHYMKSAVYKNNGEYVYFHIDGSSKLAYSAFMLLSLINIEDYPNRDNLINQIGKGILTLQQKDGSFNTFFNRISDSGKDFYPGEAMLGLMFLYNTTGNQDYLQSVKKAFPYYRDYWRNNKTTAFIPWHSQVYYLLYKIIGDAQYADFVFEMNDWIIDNYLIQDDLNKDKNGGFKSDYPGITTASYSEGLNDAYSLALLTKNEHYIKKYKDKLKLIIKFVLQLQYTQDNTFYLENSQKAIGGFKTSIINNAQRNDHTQHAIMSLMKSYENKLFE